MGCVYNFDANDIETGEKKPDILWNSLIEAQLNGLLEKGQSIRRTLYGIATDEDFILVAKLFPDYAEDSQGAITLEALAKIMSNGKDSEWYDKLKIMAVILKQVGKLPTTFDNAIYQITSYNNAYSESSDIMLTFELVPGSERSVIIRAVENNKNNKAELLKRLKRRRVEEIILYNLRNAGIDIKKNPSIISSCLDRENAEVNAEGLKEIIYLALNDEYLVRDDLSHIVGRLIVHMLGKDNPLIQRMINELLKQVKENPKNPVSREVSAYEKYIKEHPEINTIQSTIFENDGTENVDEILDVVGYIVGDMLIKATEKKIKSPEKRSGIFKLFSKIINAIKNIFRRSDVKTYKKAIRNAENDALRIADGLLNMEYTDLMLEATLKMEDGDLDDILIEKERKVRLEVYNENVKIARQVMNQMQVMVNMLRQKDKATYKKMLLDLSKIQNRYDLIDTANSVIMTSMANLAIADCLKFITGYWNDIVEDLNKIDFNDEEDFINNMGKHARRISKADIWVTTVADILTELERATNEAPNLQNKFEDFTEIHSIGEFGEDVVINMRDLLAKVHVLLLGEKHGGLIAYLNKVRKDFTLRFMKDIIGTDQITHATRVLWKRDKEALFGVRRKIEYGQTEKLEDIVTVLKNDVSWFSRQFRAMSDNSDIMGQALDKVLKEMKYMGQKHFLEERQKLLEILDYAEAKGVSFEKFYTKDEVDTSSGTEVGIPSGYLIGYITDNKTGLKIGVDWGKWANEFELFKKDARKEFKSTYARELRNTLDAGRAMLWASFFNNKYKEWHKQHSIARVITANDGQSKVTVYSPDPAKYKDGRYERLSEEEKKVLNDYIDWKREADAKYLYKGATDLFRAPQIIGTRLNSIYNRRRAGENRFNARRHEYGRRILELFCKSARDTDYGSDGTINSEDASLYTSDIKYDFEGSKMDRIPLFFINKLTGKDKVRLSTDLIGASMAYAAMATLFNMLRTVLESIQVSIDQMKKRRLSPGVLRRSDDPVDNGTSQSYKWATLYVDKELYGLTFGLKQNQNGMIILLKIVQIVTGLASRYFLGGNIHGAIANTIMGLTEVQKEAAAKEYYSTKSLKKAYKEYTKLTSLIDGSGNFLFVDAFRQIKRMKINLFAEYMDAFGENQRIFRSYVMRTTLGDRTRHALRIGDVMFHNVFAAYSSGDHMMQLLPFIAMAEEIELYYIDDDGQYKTTSLYDAYDVHVDRTPYKDTMKNPVDRGKMGKKGTFGLRKDIYYVKKAEDVQVVLKLSKLKKRIEDFLEEMKKMSGFAPFNNEAFADVLKYLDIEKVENDIDSPVNKDIVLKAKNAIKNIEIDIHDKTWQREDEANFKLRARTLANRLHGIYNIQDKTVFLRGILGSMVMAMKGYILGMVERRFGNSHYSLAFGKDVEGNLITLSKVFPMIFSSAWKQGLLLTFAPVFNSGRRAEMARNFGFSDHQYANMRRTFFDYLTILALMFTTAGLSYIKGKLPDDKNDKGVWALGILYYFLTRLQQEQSAYNEPVSFTLKEASSFTLYGSTFSFLKEIFNVIKSLSESYSRKDYFLDFLGTTYLNKGLVKFLKRAPNWRTAYTLGFNMFGFDTNSEKPWKAAETYSYARATRH